MGMAILSRDQEILMKRGEFVLTLFRRVRVLNFAIAEIFLGSKRKGAGKSRKYPTEVFSDLTDCLQQVSVRKKCLPNSF